MADQVRSLLHRCARGVPRRFDPVRRKGARGAGRRRGRGAPHPLMAGHGPHRLLGRRSASSAPNCSNRPRRNSTTSPSAARRKATRSRKWRSLKARRNLEEAEEKLRVLKHWRQTFDNRATPLLRQLDPMFFLVGRHLPKGIHSLGEAIKALQAYAEKGPRRNPRRTAATASGRRRVVSAIRQPGHAQRWPPASSRRAGRKPAIHGATRRRRNSSACI